MYEITDSLRALMQQGFQFSHNSDAEGELVSVVGVRVNQDVIDIVQIFGEHDADAVRIPSGEPDIFFPRMTLWRCSGRPEKVIEELLTLTDPAPDPDAAPGSGGGCWLPTRPGRSTWVTPMTPEQRIRACR